jgi:hypothetical protein
MNSGSSTGMTTWFKLKYLLLAYALFYTTPLGYASQSMSHTILILSSLLLVFLTMSCGDKTPVDKVPELVEASVGPIDPKVEEKAVIALLDRETQAFTAKDVDALW